MVKPTLSACQPGTGELPTQLSYAAGLHTRMEQMDPLRPVREHLRQTTHV